MKVVLFMVFHFADTTSSAVLRVLFAQLKFKLLEGKGDGPFLFLSPALAHGVLQRFWT